MTGFNNEVYSALVKDLINDAFYSKDGSIRGKIATIRQYSEVIIRKILNLSNQEYVTIGNRDIIERLSNISDNNQLLLNSLEIIKNNGNDCTHTQKIDEVSQNDLEKCIDSLFNLYAYLFIAYFKKYEFGKNNKVLSSFSLLPPIIRFIVLNSLYKDDKNNISIIDKLALAKLKAFDKETALLWLEEEKSHLEKLSTVTEQAYQEIKLKNGEMIANAIRENAPKNMYVLCKDKINEVSEKIEQNGKLYNNFEDAINFYTEKGKISGDSDEIVEFNSIMDFVYLGRKHIKNNSIEDMDKYIIST
jgi:hypothetical protein